jgi:hypothetical protein
VSPGVLLDGRLINAELLSQNVDGHAVDIALDQRLHSGRPEPQAEPIRGSEGRLRPGAIRYKECRRVVIPGQAAKGIEFLPEVAL